MLLFPTKNVISEVTNVFVLLLIFGTTSTSGTVAFELLEVVIVFVDVSLEGAALQLGPFRSYLVACEQFCCRAPFYCYRGSHGHWFCLQDYFRSRDLLYRDFGICWGHGLCDPLYCCEYFRSYDLFNRGFVKVRGMFVSTVF